MTSLSHLLCTIGQISQNFWMAANVVNPNVSTLRLIIVCLLIGFASILFLLCRSIFAVALGLQTPKSLFSQLLNSLFRAPMSFYDSTPLGRILSRVSSDLTIVDLDIRFSLIFTVVVTINAYASFGVLAVVTWQVLFVFITVIYVAIQLQIRYRLNAPLVLQGISCTFEGGHEIGVVGRTGSGKTTLIGALFRLVEPAGRKIVVVVSVASLQMLIIPFAFFFKVLGKCQLQEAVQEKEQGLDSLENYPTEFADCTVITVAHRIPTVMDCTMVLAISNGESRSIELNLNHKLTVFSLHRVKSS
ncbi:hypothetical protein Ddye_013894 [Dipteronia dyeriana]|uniref:ABC transmembrane type-1 domain-containing protein n=1 Tax=Dipteronia dyeriana TaxID=168575 RepID=A0AAD9X7U4_9ROSI|nr:hypothetical protein Ddye_013894 [Dipteronia dyeriana]